MRRIYKMLEKVSSILFKCQKIILLIMVAAIVGVTIADVFLRMVTSKGISWTQELCIALFMSLIFLGANIAMKTDSEIKIDLLHFKNEKAQRLLLAIVDIICLAIIAFLIYSSIASIQNVMARPQKLATLPLSYATLYMVMPVGFILMFLDKAVTLLRRFYDQESLLLLREEAAEMENGDK